MKTEKGDMRLGEARAVAFYVLLVLYPSVIAIMRLAYAKGPRLPCDLMPEQMRTGCHLFVLVRLCGQVHHFAEKW